MTKIALQNFTPTQDKIFVTDLEQGMTQTEGGIIIRDDVGKDHGLRPRWGRVIMTGPKAEDVSVGDWVLVEHGRWSLGFDMIDNISDNTVKIWQIDPKGMMLVTPDDPRPAQFMADANSSVALLS